MTYLALDLRTPAEIAILMAFASEPNPMPWREDFGGVRKWILTDPRAG
jgi:hypothetical protein